MTASSEHTCEQPNQLRLVKSQHLEADEFEGELILMNRTSQQVVMLNAAGLALWQGLDALPTRRAVIELVQEAFPSVDPVDVERSVAGLIAQLLAGGYLSEVPE